MKVLIVIDMQNDFVTGSLGTKEACSIVPYVKEKVEEYRKQGNPIIFTRDTHGEDYLSTLEGKNLPVKHCIHNTMGWEIIKELNTSDMPIFDKGTFGSIEMAQYMKSKYPDAEFEFVGVCTDICVISNVLLLKALLPNNQICVDAKGCAGVTVESHMNALSAMEACQITIR